MLMPLLPASKGLKSALVSVLRRTPQRTGGHRMITDEPTAETWQRDLADAVRSPEELLALLKLTPDQVPPLTDRRNPAFPLRVPRSFLRRMTIGNPQDPLLLQVLPLAAEQNDVPGFTADPVGDRAAEKTAGLLRKYPGRVLIIAAGSCAVHCRYCFRREFPYDTGRRSPDHWDRIFREVAGDPSVSEVIFSGGDPLMLPDERLSALVEQASAIAHVERVRIHTRLPVVLPSRVTERLLTILHECRVQVVMVVHANHAQEIQADCRDALSRLVRSGLPVLNQAVLLRQINDTVESQCALSRALINVGVIPYYLHRLDRVQGAAHFEVDDETGRRLIRLMQDRLPGYAVPRYVCDVPGRFGKTVLGPA